MSSASYTACCLCLTALVPLLTLSLCMHCRKKSDVQQLSYLCLIALGRLPSSSFCMYCRRIMCSSCLAFIPLPWGAFQAFSPECFFVNALQKGCAAAVLVGLDVSPQPGLRGPTNFAGVCGPALLQEMDAVLTAAHTKFR